MNKIRKEINEIRKQLETCKEESKESLQKKLNKIERIKEVYQRFEILCDGLPPYYDTETIGPNTFVAGVCKIKYDYDENILHVWLRRPGLLIGKGGQVVNKLKEELDCKIHIHEVKSLWDWDNI